MEPRLEDKTQKLNVPQSSSTYNIKIFETHSLNNMDPSEAPDESNLLVEIPSKSSNLPNESITMLSSTSLLHGNCIFNRNNTVATQAGLKTYWLCKSYRVSMCKARCITHQVLVFSVGYESSFITALIVFFRGKLYQLRVSTIIHPTWITNLKKYPKDILQTHLAPQQLTII